MWGLVDFLVIYNKYKCKLSVKMLTMTWIRWHGVLKIPPTVTLSRGLPLPTEVSTGRAWMGKQFWENLNALKSRVNLNALGVRKYKCSWCEKFKCSKVKRKYKCSGCEKILIGFFWSLSDWEKSNALTIAFTTDIWCFTWVIYFRF